MATEKCHQCNRPLRDAADRTITNPAIREVEGKVVKFHYECAARYDAVTHSPLTGTSEARWNPFDPDFFPKLMERANDATRRPAVIYLPHEREPERSDSGCVRAERVPATES